MFCLLDVHPIIVQKGKQPSMGRPLQQGRHLPDVAAAGKPPGAQSSAHAKVLSLDSAAPE